MHGRADPGGGDAAHARERSLRARNPVVRLALGIERAIEVACNLLMLVSGLGLLTLLTVVVVMRYGFESGFGFAPDLSELMFAILVMAGIAQAARRGVHVATQLVISLLPGRLRVALAVLIHSVTAAAYFLLAWYAVQNAVIAHDQATPVMHIPWSVGYGCLAIGLALVGVCSVAAIVRHTIGAEPLVVNLADPGAATV